MSTVLSKPLGPTIAGGAAVAAPGAGATLSSIGVLLAGTYKVEALTLNGGTAETTAAGLMNINIRRGTNVISAMPSATQPCRMTFERVVLDGTQSINAVVGGAAAIAGSIYMVALSAVRLGG